MFQATAVRGMLRVNAVSVFFLVSRDEKLCGRRPATVTARDSNCGQMRGLSPMRNVWRLTLAAALVLTLGVGSASADITNYLISVPNSAISGFPGPYASVQVNRTSTTTATITFTSLTNSGNIYLMGGAQAADVNVNATSWTLSGLTASNAGTGFTPGPLSDGGANNVGPFGSFNQTIDSFDGFTHASDLISFMLTNTGGTWGSAGSVLTNNAFGAVAAAHIFITASPANAANGAINTGFAAVPEPGPLLGGGIVVLMGLGLSWRRRTRATA